MLGLFGSVWMLITEAYPVAKIMASNREQTFVFLKQRIPPIDFNIRIWNQTIVLTDNPTKNKFDKQSTITGARKEDRGGFGTDFTAWWWQVKHQNINKGQKSAISIKLCLWMVQEVWTENSWCSCQ